MHLSACEPCTSAVRLALALHCFAPSACLHVRAMHVCRARAQGGLINMGFRKYASAVENFASAVDKFDQQWRTTNTILVAMPFICFILMCA